MPQDLRGLTVAHYKLIEPIADGALWRAREERLERDVAVKIVFPSSDEEDARKELRLLIEAKAAARIHSRHVARVLMLGHTDDGALFVATELLQGETLEALLAREGRLELERGLRIARHVARGLMAAHGAGVLHRGLEPARIMLVHDDGDEEVAKIIDFGVAKRLQSCDAELTRRGELLAAEEYVAPELREGAEGVDARVDIYSFGAILRKLVGDSAPSFVNDVIRRCLEPDRNARFTKMAEVLSALSPRAVRVEKTELTELPAELTVDDLPTIREAIAPIGVGNAPPDFAIAAPTAAVLRSSLTRPRVVAAVCAAGALLVVGGVFETVAQRAVDAKSELNASRDDALVVDVQTALIQPPVHEPKLDPRVLLPRPPPPDELEVDSEIIVTARPLAQITATEKPARSRARDARQTRQSDDSAGDAAGDDGNVARASAPAMRDDGSVARTSAPALRPDSDPPRVMQPEAQSEESSEPNDATIEDDFIRVRSREETP